jgi:hypothetical protein
MSQPTDRNVIEELFTGEVFEPEETEHACRCGASFPTYDRLLEHISTGGLADAPHISVENAERMGLIRDEAS